MINSSYLAHHGIKGQRWGVIRFRNKDGSLTSFGKKHNKETGSEDEKKEETTDDRRARVLKSTNAKEIYKNKDILTTGEIQERLTRIDTEVRLSRVAEGTKTTGMNKVDTVIKYARKANEIYELTNTPLGKMIKKSLGGEVESNMPLDLKKILKKSDKIWENRDKIPDDELSKILKRASMEKAFKKMVDDDADILGGS